MAKKKVDRRQAGPGKPSMTLLCKLGSIIVHVDEFLSPDGHHLDLGEVKVLIADPDVQQWLKDMGPLVPKKRNER